MATNLNSLLAGIGFWSAAVIAGGLIMIVVIGLLVWWNWNKKRWYLKVYFKIIREGGNAVIREEGKGRFDFDQGVLWIKRPKKKPESMKIKSLDKYLSGDNSIEVIGNPDNWKLIIPESYNEVYDEETGEQALFAKLVTDTKEDRAWAVQAERSWKNAFSVQNLLYEYKDFIGWGLVIFIQILADFVGFSYLNTHR